MEASMDSNKPLLTRILVPIDGSPLADQAIPFAVRFAGRGGRIVLLRVAPLPEAVKSVWGGTIATEERVEAMNAEDATDDLNRACRFIPTGVDVEAEVVTGDPADQIIQSSLRHASGLIVMASHGRGALGRWAFGSVADRVARESLVPVTIVRPDPKLPVRSTIERLVVPLDGSTLANQALPVATELAVGLGVPVQLVRVINPAISLYPALAATAPVSDESYQAAYEREELDVAQTLCDGAYELRQRGVEVITRTMVGSTVQGIEATLAPGDVVLITSHGRSGIRRLLLGSVAEQLVRIGTAPVILVPSGERRAVIEGASAMLAMA